MPESEQERAERKKREAEERRAKETPEERAERKRKEAERTKETPEQRAERKLKEAERAKETPEERLERKKREAEQAKAAETPEERAERKKREAEKARAAETPEERAARKKLEAEKARAAETPEERLERKKREAEKARAAETPEQRAERKKREAEKAKEKEEADERRRQQRDERPVIHKQATPSASGAASPKKPATDATPKAPEHKPIQAQAPKQAAAAAADDEEDEYDDDDFEEVIDQDSLADAIRATEAENARIRAAQLAAAQQQQQAAAGKTSSKTSSSSGGQPQIKGEARAGLDVDSLTRQKHKAQYEKDLQRALALRRLVDLDEVKFTICDISPQSQYEVFLRSMAAGSTTAATATTGASSSDKTKDADAAQVVAAPIASASVQAPEQRVDVEIQAERVSRKSRSMQAPDDLGLFPEALAAKQASKAKGAAAQTDAAAGGEGGDDAEGGDKKGSGGPRVTALDKRRVDTAALGAFMSSVFPCFRTLMDENDQRAKNKHGGGGDGATTGSPASAAAAKKHTFSATTPTVLKHDVAAGRPVVSIAYSQLAPQYVVVAHGPIASAADEAAASSASSDDYKRASAFPCVALLWNANDASRPDKVLVAPAPIADICMSPTKNFIIYGALAHGALCVWDLREPEGSHGGSALRLGLRTPSYTSGWASGDLAKGGLRRVLVSGYNSATGMKNADEAEQALTLGDDGEVVFWMLNADDNRRGGGGGGAGHHGGSHGGGGVASALQDHNHGSPSGGGLRSSGSFSMNSPSRRRQATSNDNTDLGLALNSGVHLYRAATINALEDTRAKNARAKSGDNASGVYSFDTGSSSAGAGGGATSLGGAGADEFSGRHASITLDVDISPTDASHLLVAGSTAVHHVSKFGSITAPSQYSMPSPTPATAVSCCPTDSRLMLVGYENGSVRLFLREEAVAAYTSQLSEHAIVSVRWATNRRWIAFILDAAGHLHVLDLAAANKVKPVATASGATEAVRFTSFGVSHEERDTRLAIGQADGVVTVHTVGFDAILPVQIQRNERWL